MDDEFTINTSRGIVTGRVLGDYPSNYLPDDPEERLNVIADLREADLISPEMAAELVRSTKGAA